MVTIIFLTEITIRFFGEENKKDFFKNPWNLFDALIVMVSLIPIDNTNIALVVRLIRVFRVLRMVSIIPGFRILLDSLPQLGFVLLFMFIIYYIYAAMSSILLEQINPVLWGDITVSLLTLFRVMTFEDWTDVMYETMAVYPLSRTFYTTFIFSTAFTFLNMVIGIVVNLMNEEQQKLLRQKAIEAHEPSIQDLMIKLESIEAKPE